MARAIRPAVTLPKLPLGTLSAIGLPYKRIIAATNVNDTVPRFLASGRWDPNPTVTTITNAMDISLPNNFPRVLELGERHGLPLETLLSSLSLHGFHRRPATGTKAKIAVAAALYLPWSEL